VSRLGEQPLAGRRLDDPAGVHHVDGVAETGDDAEVVGDHQQGGVGVGHQPLEHLEDLRLDRHVERRGRLVCDEQPRLAGERDRDQHPLPHSAGQLVRVVLEPARRVRDPDLLEELGGAVAGVGLRDVEVLLDDLGDLHPDRHDRVERGHRVLEDHRDVAPTQLGHAVPGLLEEVPPAVPHLAGDRDAAGGQQPHDGEGGDGLAAAGLPHQPHVLARADLEADVVDGLGRLATAELEGHREVAYGEQRLVLRVTAHGVISWFVGRAPRGAPHRRG
jgi:hypothetical protein